VLTLGINYRDGLYRVEQMRVHEAMQPVPDPLPAPLVVLPHAVDDQVALLLRANAVVVAARHLPAPAVEEALTEKFRQGALYPRRFAIWVRR
jgi:hypothetical protein